MKQTLIKITDDHYVIVDDSEIKEGDWCLYKNKFGGQFICQAYVYERTLMFDDGSFNRSLGEGITPQKDECKKITHSTQPNKGMENVTFISPREVKELIGKMDVEKKADDIIPNLLHKKYVKTGFIAGYNQALEDNKDKIDKILDFLISKMESISQDMIDKDSLHLGRFRTYKQIYEMIKPKTEWEVEIVDGKLKLKL